MNLSGRLFQAKAVVLWVCDPMHGNTLLSPSGFKQRHFMDVLGEIRGVAKVLAAKGERLGGLHLELTGRFLPCKELQMPLIPREHSKQFELRRK